MTEQTNKATKYYYLGDCKAVMPTMEMPKERKADGTLNKFYHLALEQFKSHLASLPTLAVHPDYAATLKVAEWFEGKVQYEVFIGKWITATESQYNAMGILPGQRRTIIIQPPPVGGEQGDAVAAMAEDWSAGLRRGGEMWNVSLSKDFILLLSSFGPLATISGPPGGNKPFIVANVREIFDNEETSYSRKVELLNEVAAKFYQPRTDSEAVELTREQVEAIWDASHERFINSIFLTNKIKKQ